jgi:HJR/Mrr/RecB family endonuclease
VDGNSITQIIDRGDTNWKYPIVADPNWWQITKCVGSLAWVVGSAVFSVAKIAKIKKYINAFGGLTKTARLLLGATSAAEKATAIGKGFLTFAASVTGVDGVYTHCIKGK